ncbi:MAG TPA: DUF6152 family protein [Gammaproteobacteria bacterium]|nr:DUF6152 family protein [Gammaproteobacteria bacterium]
MRSVTSSLVAAAAVLFVSGQAMAHHSFAAEFNADQKVTLTGIVTKVQWTNPHVWFYVNVKDKDTGEVKNYGMEMGAPHLLQRRGWRRETLKIGTEVTVNGFLARNGSNKVSARSVTLTATGSRPGQTLDAASSKDNNQTAVN